MRRWAAALAIGLLALPLGGSDASAAPNPGCASSLAAVAWSNFATAAPGTVLTFHVAVANVGSTTCTLITSATSPLFRVMDAAGREIWDSTEVNGHPGPIPLFLAQRTLAPGTVLRASARWDQHTASGLAPRGGDRLVVTTSGAPSAVASLRLGLENGPPTVVLPPAGSLTALARVGAAVVLVAAGGLYVYGAPIVRGPLARTQRRVGRALVLTAVATAPGIATITSSASPVCYPQCLMPSRLLTWRVRIIAAP